MPLAKTLYSNRLIPIQYVGVDLNDFDIPKMLKDKKLPIRIWAETDFCDLDPWDVSVVSATNDPPYTSSGRFGLHEYVRVDDGKVVDTYRLPNVLTCFECLEHVTPAHCRRLLQHMLEVTAVDCHYFISTPCWNSTSAENHINEVSFQALGTLLEDVGFKVEGMYGTFASISDYKDELSNVKTYFYNGKGELESVSTDLRHIFGALRNYYDTNILAIIFAPLFPDKSRNCLWHLTRATRIEQARLFSPWEQVTTPWGQHPSWLQLSGYDHKHTKECLDKDAQATTCGMEGLWLQP